MSPVCDRSDELPNVISAVSSDLHEGTVVDDQSSQSECIQSGNDILSQPISVTSQRLVGTGRCDNTSVKDGLPVPAASAEVDCVSTVSGCASYVIGNTLDNNEGPISQECVEGLVNVQGDYSLVFNHDDRPRVKPTQSADRGIAGQYMDHVYKSPLVIENRCPMSTRVKPRHTIGGIPSQMNVSSWDHYLHYENDLEAKMYLHDGIAHGFAIVDDWEVIPPYYCVNYPSALNGEAFPFIDDLISEEIKEGKYVEASTTPHCVHALGAVPKQDGTFRPITDCRRPEGSSINNFMSSTFQTFTYTTIDEVASHVSSGCYMATVDISAAYRSIHVRHDQWTYQGVMWPKDDELIPLWDARLAFGLRCAPYIFTEISNFIARTMTRLGHAYVANYLDDFLVFGSSFEECQQAQMSLITLLGELGFYVSWKKCSSPSTCVRYLGILIDSQNMSLSLPQDKLDKLKNELEFFKNRTRATKKQIQRLCGVIAHCAKVVRGGRTFSRRIIDLLGGLSAENPRIRLSEEFMLDLHWWISFASEFNGKENIIFPNNGNGPIFATDSCLKGYGILHDRDWQAGYFNSTSLPDLCYCCDNEHGHWMNVNVGDLSNINYLELVPIWLALLRYKESWKDSHVVCLTDNTQVVVMLRSGHSVNKDCMVLLRRIFWLCAKNNIYITSKHVPGCLNTIPDMLSRVCEFDSLANITSYSVAVIVSELDNEVSAAVGAAWSSNTLSTRNSQWKRYLKFCTDIHEVPLPSDIRTIVRFLVYLARDCKYSTVNNYLSAVISLHRFYGYDVQFRESFLVKLVLRGLKARLGDHRVQMQLLTVEQLKRIYELCVVTPLDHVLWTIVILSFRSLLRKSNLVPDSGSSLGHVLRRQDVILHEWGIMLCVRSSKTLQYNQYVLEIPVSYVSDKRFCAASALKQHMASTPGRQDGPLFMKEVGGKFSPVLYKELLSFIKDSVVSIGLPPHEYGAHSLRRSGVSFLHGVGVPLEDLMSMGDWHSLAVLDYLVTPTSRKMEIQDMVVSALERVTN